MRIEITRVTSWKDVLNAARFTWKKEPLDKEPSTKFKKQIIKAQHSPLRCLMFNIDLYDVPFTVVSHLVRHHVSAQPFVASSRPDVDKTQRPRTQQLKIDPTNVRIFLNAEEIINISKARLCNKAEAPTRIVWQKVIDKLKEIEPELANACVPNCLYRGFCPEITSCGMADSPTFPKMLSDYHYVLCN